MIRPRLRTFALWTGTLLCLLIAAAFVGSAWWRVTAQVGEVAGYIVGGAVVVMLDYPLTIPFVVERHAHHLGSWNAWKPGARYIVVPLYAVFLTVAVPTLLVWRYWPKPPKPGHCRCGYDLTGNTSGVCPECGVEVQA